MNESQGFVGEAYEFFINNVPRPKKEIIYFKKSSESVENRFSEALAFWKPYEGLIKNSLTCR